MPLQTIQEGALEYLTAPGIAVPHGFTTRFGGVSVGALSSLNLAIREGETMENVEQNLHILGDALGFDCQKLVMTRQIHSDLVRVVGLEDAQGLCHRDYPACDGLVTNTPGVALLVFSADCTPILFHDPVTGAVGAVHAGWRGTAKAIAARCVEKMTEAFGTNPADIRAAIGPNIGQCHFETDADVPQAMAEALGDEIFQYMEMNGNKYHLDLKAINAMILRRAGVRQIDISTDCTYCQSSRFWSHRASRGDRGSQGAVILCREARV